MIAHPLQTDDRRQSPYFFFAVFFLGAAFLVAFLVAIRLIPPLMN